MPALTSNPRPQREVPPPSTPAPKPGLARVYDSMTIPNFRWFLVAMIANFGAMNVQLFIRGWLVFKLTASFEALGIVHLANGVAGVIASLVGGVLADRLRQKLHIVQVAQAANGLNALVIASLLATGNLLLWHLIAAAVVQGIVQHSMLPARQALIAETVGRSQLTNAVALNAAGMNTARVLMPGLAGWALAALGGEQNIGAAGWVYLSIALLYFSAIVFMLPIRLPDHVSQVNAGLSPLEQFRDSLRYTRDHEQIRLLLIVNLFMAWLGMTYFMLLPGFAEVVLGTGAEGLGVLTSLVGAGSVIGGLAIAALPQRRRGRVLLWSSLALGLVLLAFSASTSFALSAGILVLVGLFQSPRMSLPNALIQTHVDDDYRGRIMALYMMEFALMGFGIYAMGLLAQLVGPQVAVGSSAIGLVLLSGGLLLFSPRFRALE